MLEGKSLVIRRAVAGEDLFHAREFATAQSLAKSAGGRSHTLLWASQDMPQENLMTVLGERGWTDSDIARELSLAIKSEPEV